MSSENVSFNPYIPMKLALIVISVVLAFVLFAVRPFYTSKQMCFMASLYLLHVVAFVCWYHFLKKELAEHAKLQQK